MPRRSPLPFRPLVVALLLVLPARTQAQTPPPALQCLLASYPGALCAATAIDLVWCDGSHMPLHDGSAGATHQAQLEYGDLAAQMAQVYTPFAPLQPPGTDVEPGRIRNAAFLAKLYGQTPQAVRRKLQPLRWLDGTIVRIQGQFGLPQQLAAVRDDLARLPADVVGAARHTAGAFVWRRIHGTQRQSAHAYGIAIDVGVAASDYWQWDTADAQGRRIWHNRMAPEVVAAFERHGFIWGGRWDHYDTMHFEYRPELLHPACVGHAAPTVP